MMMCDVEILIRTSNRQSSCCDVLLTHDMNVIPDDLLLPSVLFQATDGETGLVSICFSLKSQQTNNSFVHIFLVNKSNDYTNKPTMSAVDRCLGIDKLLDKILGYLPLRKKFAVQSVSRRWRQRSIIVLKDQKSVVLSSEKSGSFELVVNEKTCKDHPAIFENLICFDMYDMNLRRKVLSFLPGIKILHVDYNDGIFDETWGDDSRLEEGRNNSNLFKDILRNYGSQLLCLWINIYYEDDTDDLQLDSCLQELRHLHIEWPSDESITQVLKFCPKLEYLSCFTFFMDWNLLPQGFKKLESDSSELKGLDNLLVSPAAETLEEILEITVTSEAFDENFHLSSLKVLRVTVQHMQAETNASWNKLARILRFSPQLTELSLKIITNQDIEAASWIKVIEECPRVTDFNVQLTEYQPKTKVHLWQDAFAESILLNMRRLKSLRLEFSLSSIGLMTLSSLPELEFFHHELHTKIPKVGDLIFNENALYSFLTAQFSRKLNHYELVSIYDDNQSFLPVSKGFVDQLTHFAEEVGLTIDIQTKERGFYSRPLRKQLTGLINLSQLVVDRNK